MLDLFFSSALRKKSVSDTILDETVSPLSLWLGLLFVCSVLLFALLFVLLFALLSVLLFALLFSQFVQYSGLLCVVSQRRYWMIIFGLVLPV